MPVTVLHLHGHLDGRSIAAVRDSLHHLIDTTRDAVVVDFSDVQRIDATGLGVLLAVHRRLQRDERQLVLRGCTGQIRRALAMTRLLRIMHVEPVPGSSGSEVAV